MDRRFTASILSSLVAAIGLLSVTGAPALAYGWGYSPWSGVNSALWLGRTLGYPMNRYSAVQAPYYLAQTLLYNGATGGSRLFGAKPRNTYYGDYLPGDQIDPRPRIKPYPPADQLSYSGPVNPAMSAPNGAPLPVPAGAAAADPQIAPAFAYPRSASPMAKGFIDVVNQQYNGDLSKALFDPNTRAYAKAVGLVGSDDLFDADLAPEKVELIRKILADDREDAATRLTTIRLLLKHQ